MVNSGETGDYLTYFYAKNNGQAITWGGMNKSDSWVNNNQGITANGSYIRFNGDATVTVTFTPNGGGAGNINYVNASQSSANQTISDTEFQTVTISPETHYYEPFGNGYRVVLNITNVELDTSYGAKFVNVPSEIVQYSKINLPKRSSVVDFSQRMSSRPVYNSNLVVYGQDMNGSVYSTTKYDSNLGYWRSTGGYNNFFDMQLYSKNDFYFLLEDVYDTASKVETCWNIGTSGDTRTTFYRPGLTRVYSDYTKHLSYTGYGITGKEQFIHAGFTQPINTALYEYGVGKNSDLATTDNYVSPGSDFNRTVLKQLTTDACTKLKDAGARVYVVKYRKQSNWGALTRLTGTTYKTSPTAHSYTEIDNCATNSGGFIREAANEDALKEVLDEIATDIKSSEFANYKEAELK